MGDPQLSLFPVLVPPGAAGPVVAELPRRIPAEGAELVASILGTPVPCRIRRSPRARRLGLIVDRSAVLTVVLPARFPLREVPGALEENARWVLRTVERHRRRPRPQRPPLADGREIHVLGVPHLVRLLDPRSLDQPPRVWRRGAEILVHVPPLHSRSPAEMLRTWLRALAASELPRRVRALNDPLGFSLGRITVRDQKTKWGACSARGNISLNWRLLIAPVDVLDYVILHELCHLRELNHSPRFWALLRSLISDFERPRAWLRQNGDALDV